MATVPMDDLLRLAVDEGASDLHISPGSPPALRIDGQLTKLEIAPLDAAAAERLIRSVTSEVHLTRAHEQGTVDFAISVGGGSRFRVSVFRQKGALSAVLRAIPRELLSADQIGLPEAVRELVRAPRGLVLVTGPTGCGKSTTLACLIDAINASSRSHIITIEDPIEYFHEHRRGLINQREVGADVPGFAEGLRRALRQDPDVILVGEMRDLETMETAIRAAETGHLVFSTLHTTGAARTVDRIIDAFPVNQQQQIRVQLASNLRAVVSQLLLPRRDGRGRIAVFEVMVWTPSIAALIRDNKSYRINTDIQTGAKHGMVSLEAALADLVRRGVIFADDALAVAQDPEAAEQLIRGTKPPG